MRAYEVEMIRDGKVKYFFIRNMKTMEIELLPTRFLTHKTRAQESPNTVGSLARSICYYMNFCDGRQMGFTDVCQMDYEAQFNHFTDFLQWLKAGNHTKNLKKTPRNRTCNTYLKNVFGFFSFLEMAEDQFGPLQVLSYGTIHVANSVGVKRRLRFRSFAGYLKEEEREVRAAEKNEIVTILEACTNCRDQLLILMASELGFRIGELLGIDYTKDIDYENHSVRVCFRDDNANDARAKNAEERKGRLSADTYDFLLFYISEYWDILRRQNYLFINITGETEGKPMQVASVYDMFHRMEKKTGIKITPHMLRRYFANARWDSGWPLELVSQSLGHRHLDTTTRYLNLMDDKLKQASTEFYNKHSALYGVQELL